VCVLDLRGGAGGSGGWLAGSRSVRDSFALMKFVHWPLSSSRQPDRTGTSGSIAGPPCSLL
jgi:hypothetical protein